MIVWLQMIVYKFGGTSLLEEELVIKNIKEGLKKYKKILVVVSAIGRYPSPYATDTLSNLALNVSDDEKALLISCGEVISSVKLSSLLKKEHIKSIALSIYDINLEFTDKFKVSYDIVNYIHKYDVVIIPGFIGLKGNKICLLQRGGSNITASFFANYFNSNLVIFTDVDGLYDVDPKENKNGKKYKKINYETLRKLAKNDPKLFPIKGIEYLEEKNINVLVRSNVSSNGTKIGKK